MSIKPKTQTKTKPQAASRVLETVYETAADLERLGFIDKRKMQKLDALCMEPIAPYDSAQIRALREQHNLSQTVMATVLNTSASTVRKWEIGEKHPSGPSLKFPAAGSLDQWGVGGSLDANHSTPNGTALRGQLADLALRSTAVLVPAASSNR